MEKYICIDIGGTAIKYGIISADDTILTKNQMDTQAHKGGPEILKKVINIVQNAIDEYGEKIIGICISTAGMVDDKKGEIFYSAPLIPNYAGTQFKKVLEEKFHIPCEVENDVKCAGLAEYKTGAGKNSSIMLMLTIGTGIGGCIIIDGKIFHGFSNSACEVGYMYMDGSDYQTLGAASILTQKVAEWKGESKDNWNGYRIFEEAKNGDELCNRAIDEMSEAIAKGIANICCVINPEVVVLGGGIMAQEEFLKDKIENGVKKYLVSSIEKNTTIKFAKHRNDAGILGAYYNFCNKHSK